MKAAQTYVGTSGRVAARARSVAPDAALGSLSLTAICGFALASAIGMLSVLVPAGVGVRDGILALLLVEHLGHELGVGELLGPPGGAPRPAVRPTP